MKVRANVPIVHLLQRLDDRIVHALRPKLTALHPTTTSSSEERTIKATQAGDEAGVAYRRKERSKR